MKKKISNRQILFHIASMFIPDTEQRMAQEFTDKEKEAFRKRIAYWRSKGFDTTAARFIASMPTKEARRAIAYSATESPEFQQQYFHNAPADHIGSQIQQSENRLSEISSAPLQATKAFTESTSGLAGLDTFVCGFGAIVCSGALITLGAEASGWTYAAWFWSVMIVIPSTILLSLKFKIRSFASWVQKALGVGLICIGYTTMHASIETNEEHAVAAVAASSTEVIQLKSHIADLEARLKPSRIAIAGMDPLRFRTAIARLHAESKLLEDELALTRRALIVAERKEAAKISTGNAGAWSRVELLRRLMLEPLNILCLHGFLAGLPNLANALRRRRIRLAQMAT